MPTNPSPELLKALSHPTRLAILRRLMAGPVTLSMLGAQFGETPAHIRHHLQILLELGLAEADPTAPRRSHLEKYYRATSAALLLNVTVLPEPPAGQAALVIASKDIAARSLDRSLAQAGAGLAVQIVPLNSLDGLIALRQGACQMATCHLLDPLSEEYNHPFIRHLFPSQPIALVRVYRREEGLIVKPGNPRGIRSLEDLARPDVQYVNREAGSGVRQWLDLHLKQRGIQTELIPGYQHVMHSHLAVAQAIYEGKADVGIGITASAREFGLDFIPLFDEPYDFTAPLSFITDQRYAPFFEYLNSGEFRTTILNLDGYSLPQNSGEIEVII